MTKVNVYGTDGSVKEKIDEKCDRNSSNERNETRQADEHPPYVKGDLKWRLNRSIISLEYKNRQISQHPR